MSRLGGRQYFLVTPPPMPAGGGVEAGLPAPSGPTGIIAYALPRE